MDVEPATGEAARPDERSRAYAPPLSVTRDELLIEGRDDRFRELIHALFITASRFEDIREAFGREIGVTGAQYFIINATAQHQGTNGVGIRALADYLHVAAPHITTEVGKLVGRGLLRKRTNPDDRRGVLVSLTPDGEAALGRLAPFRQEINNVLFQGMSREDFLTIARFMDAFIDSTAQAVRRTAEHEDPRGRRA